MEWVVILATLILLSVGIFALGLFFFKYEKPRPHFLLVVIVTAFLGVANTFMSAQFASKLGHDTWIGVPGAQHVLEVGSVHEVITTQEVPKGFAGANYLVVIPGEGRTIRVCSMDHPLPPGCTKVIVMRHKDGFGYLAPFK